MDRRYLPPATFAAASALLHVIAAPLARFTEALMPSLVGALVWAALAFGLLRGSRAVVYLAFIAALIGISGAMSIALVAIATPVQWIWSAIVVVDVLVAVTLFLLLWCPRSA